MKQGELFNDVCETYNSTSHSDADLIASTSTDQIGQKPIDEVECIKCGIHQDISNFNVMPSGEIKRTCRSCKAGHRAVINKLRAENKYPDEDYSCPICTRTIQEIGRHGQKSMQSWVLDHCHETETFRGWICKPCNTGIGQLQDNPDNAHRAFEYLVKHRMTNGI
jgi:hypothetical protein